MAYLLAFRPRQKPVAASRVFLPMEKIAPLVLVVGIVLLVTAGALWIFG
jgi:hypothetical protein